MKVKHRLMGLAWLAEKDHALVTEFDRDRRWRTTTLVDLTKPDASRKVLFDLSINDAYGDPGTPMTVTRPDGQTTILQDGDAIYLVGQGASPEGSRPFLDRMDLKTGEKSRLFHCAPRAYELPLGFVGDSRSNDRDRATSRSHEPPNDFTVDLSTPASGPGSPTTAIPAPRFIRRQEGADHLPARRWSPALGHALPAGRLQGGHAAAADRLGVPARIQRRRDGRAGPHVALSCSRASLGPSQLFFVLQGYALLDNATMPVVGDPETMNDTYIEQISAAARAAIETLDKKGVIDPRRVGVGGHSYGAFMTANLLAHTDLFAAGIARSGAYNRSLTPFGFQTERRSYWEATDLYTKMSPFSHAAQDQRADPADPRRGRQQHRHVPDPVGADCSRRSRGTAARRGW